MTLARLQNDFADFLRDRSDAVRSHLRGGPHADLDTMLGIYRNAYTLRLTGILRSDYSRLNKLAGDETFNRIAAAYLAAHPSTFFSVRWVGAALPGFLAATEPWRRNPELAQLAQLEWAQVMAFDATDKPLAVRDDVATVAPDDWPGLSFVPHASVQVLSISPDIHALWQALGGEPIGARPARFAADAPHLVWRLGLDVKLRPLETDEAVALEAAIAGESYAAICERLAGQVGDERAAMRAAELLARWIDNGMIGRVNVTPTQSG